MCRLVAVSHPISPPRTALWETQWGQLNGLWWLLVHSTCGAFGRVHARVFPNLVINQVMASLWGFSLGYPRGSLGYYDSYLVDSASSHMLVSKIKPCMSKYKQLYRETANGSLNQLSFI